MESSSVVVSDSVKGSSSATTVRLPVSGTQGPIVQSRSVPGGERQPHLVMAAPVMRARRLPDAIQATGKVEPYFVRDGRGKVETSSKHAFDGRWLAPFADHGSHLGRARQE